MDLEKTIWFFTFLYSNEAEGHWIKFSPKCIYIQTKQRKRRSLLTTDLEVDSGQTKKVSVFQTYSSDYKRFIYIFAQIFFLPFLVGRSIIIIPIKYWQWARVVVLACSSQRSIVAAASTLNEFLKAHRLTSSSWNWFNLLGMLSLKD